MPGRNLRPRQAVLFLLIALITGCQSTHDLLETGATPGPIPSAAASAIAGDMASRLAEQIGPAGTTPVAMENDGSDYGVALEAAFKGWGYTIVTESRGAREKAPIAITYSLDGFDGAFLAQVGTPSIALARTYSVGGKDATPSSPLSILQRN